MAGWDDLDHELTAWARAGATPTLWWRDDDATRPSSELDRLLTLTTAAAIPLALAVIPRDAEPALAAFLVPFAAVFVLQHGWAHANHAPAEKRAEEYGPERPLAVRIAELARGWERLARFARARPVLVAPWNRLDPAVPPALPGAGLAGVSTLGPRARAEAAPGVREVNVHVDVMNWETRRFAGEDHVLARLADHLRARRLALVDATEPTGLMTHHLFHDEEAWRFLEELPARLDGRARWLGADEAFWPEGRA